MVVMWSCGVWVAGCGSLAPRPPGSKLVVDQQLVVDLLAVNWILNPRPPGSRYQAKVLDFLRARAYTHIMSTQTERIVQEAATQAESGPICPPLMMVEESLNALATATTLPSYVRTRNVREQFLHAFELIGGIPRLAHWAHQNPDKFFPLYSKLIPAQVTGADGGAIKIELSWLNSRDTSGRSLPQTIDVEPINGQT